MNWDITSLDKIVTFQRGFDLPKTKFKNGLIPVVGSTNVLGYHNEFKVSPPGVVTGRSGTLGHFQYLNKKFWPHNTTLWVKDFKGNSPKYVYYLLKTLNFSHLNGGSSVPTLNRNVLKSIHLKYTSSIQTQKRIADILSNYDDLIENNLKRINLLEQAAQNIYKEWFVNMRFPGFKSAEFDSATGLPVGWKKLNLYDIADIQMGYPFKAHQFNQEEKGNPVVRIRDIPKNFTETFTTESVSEKYRILNGDILIGMDGIFHIDAWSGQNDALLVQRVCRVKAYQSILHGYLLEALRAPISYFEQTISGATVAHLGAKHLKEIFISIPSESTVTRLELFNKLLNQKVLLYKQNQKLKEARDILLPRLMNQTIEV